MQRTISKTVRYAIVVGGIVLGAMLSYWYMHKQEHTGQPYIIYKVEDDPRDVKDVLDILKSEADLLVDNGDYNDLYQRFVRRSYKWTDPSKDGSLDYYVIREKDTQDFIGFMAIYQVNFYKGRILFLAIHPEKRGKRYAGALMRFAFDRFKEMGLKKAMITPFIDNIPAQKAYEREGFKEYMRDDTFVYYEYDL